MNNVIVTVTEQDIAAARAAIQATPKGKASIHGYICPVSQAIQRGFQHVKSVYVGKDFVQVVLTDGARSDYGLPDEATDFIRRFDQREPVETISFEMVREHHWVDVRMI